MEGPYAEPMPEYEIEGLLESGVPPEAIRDDRTLDVEVLRAAGWTVTDEGFWPPDTAEHGTIAQRNADRAMTDPNTTRGYR